MTNAPNQPEPWETELRDAADTIPDTEATSDSLRNRLYAESWSDGTGRRAVDLDRAADIAHAEVERLTAERAALWDLLKQRTRESRIWCRRANTVMGDAVEQTARNMQRAGQLRRERDEARAEVERLRDENKKLRNEMAVTRTCLRDELSSAFAQMDEAHADNRRLHVQKAMARAEVDRLRDRIATATEQLDRGYPVEAFLTLTGPKPDPAREAALGEMAYESARETTDFAAHWPINTRETAADIGKETDR